MIGEINFLTIRLFCELLYSFFMQTLREKCPNTEFFLVRIQSKYGKIRTRKNSLFGKSQLNGKKSVDNKFISFKLVAYPLEVRAWFVLIDSLYLQSLTDFSNSSFLTFCDLFQKFFM